MKKVSNCCFDTSGSVNGSIFMLAGKFITQFTHS